MTHQATIVTQLRALLQLTRTEVQIARIRVAQARTDAVRRELQRNGDNAEQRSRLLAEQLRETGGVPDVVTPVLGRFLALVKSAVEQGEPLDEALLGDLALEHQLLDRARYLAVLAERAGNTPVRRLAERLVTAHTATVDWLTTVLAEEALGGPVALRPTPLQRIAGGVTRFVNLPSRVAVESVNRAVDTVVYSGEQARSKVGDVAGQAARLGGAAREVFTAGRDASLQRAERVAHSDGARGTADLVHETRRELGSLTAAELPVKAYDDLSTTEAVAAIKKLDRVEDIDAVIRYEEAHKGRSGVASAAQTRLAAVAKEAAGVR